MPRIQSVNTIDVTPEKYLNACDSTELHELELLLSSPQYQEKMGRKSKMRLKKKEMRLKQAPVVFDMNTCHQCGTTNKESERLNGHPINWVAPNLCSDCVENSPLCKYTL